MSGKSLAIIGAGVAGLAAGCYGRMNGYTTHIFEQAARPGGVCTSWQRGEYTFDGCIQWLVGTRPGSPLNHIWQELGALSDGRPIVDHDELVRVESRDGRALHVYTDADRLEQHLCELSPADAGAARALCDAIRCCATFDQPSQIRGNLIGAIPRVASALPSLAQLAAVTWQEVAARFTDHFVRDALRSVFDLPDFPALGGVMTLGWMHARDAGYPIGGSLAFAEAIEARYRQLGGEISYQAPVETIIVEHGRAAGVRLQDGSEFRADYTISCADGHATIFTLLGGRFVDDAVRKQYAAGAVFKPLILVSLGVDANLSAQPHSLTFPLAAPVCIAGAFREQLTVLHRAYDPTLAPAGKTALSVMMDTDFDWWAAVSRDPALYGAEKSRIADTVQHALRQRFGTVLDRVEEVDVATPMTWLRHTGNWRGAFEGWLPTRSAMARSVLGGGMRKTLPGLADFYMSGQWVEPGGGLPGVAPASRALIQRLCKQDHHAFVV